MKEFRIYYGFNSTKATYSLRQWLISLKLASDSGVFLLDAMPGEHEGASIPRREDRKFSAGNHAHQHAASLLSAESLQRHCLATYKRLAQSAR